MGESTAFELFPEAILWRLLIFGVALGVIAWNLLGGRAWRTPLGLLVGICAVACMFLSVIGFAWNGAVGFTQLSSATMLMR